MKPNISINKNNVPTVIASSDTAEPKHLWSLIETHHDELIEQLKQYGVILFRGFACEDTTSFSKAIELCGLGNRCTTKDYAIPRTVLPNDIYTSSDLPGHVFLPLHHEKPRSKNPPNHLYFCCVTPSLIEGGTILANAQSIWLDLPQPIQDKLLAHGVIYRQFFHGPSLQSTVLKKILGTNIVRSWSEHYGTDNKIEIEKKITEEGLSWEWINEGNDLIVLNHLPGVLEHPISNQMCWFNSSAYLNYYSNSSFGELANLRALQYFSTRYLIHKDRLPMVCHYGNGEAFSSSDIQSIDRVVQAHTFVINWQKGDFMVIDNYTFMHGKQPHQGERLLYSCMTQSI